jgi:large subunit ribosomal protein L4
MEAIVYNQKGEKLNAVNLPESVFGLKMNPDLVYQVAVTQAANRRRITAHTKDRGEVSGGGKKPWRQKGTGRSRHGSNRSPIWRHGGVVFGPRNDKVYGGKINKKMRRKALAMVLSAKASGGMMVLVDKIEFDVPKTKVMAQMLEAIKKVNENFKTGKVLVALPEFEKNAVLSGRNIPGAEMIEAAKLNTLDLLNAKCLLLPSAAVKVVERIVGGGENEKSEKKSEKQEKSERKPSAKKTTKK